MSDIVNTTKLLSQLPGVSGDEGAVRQAILSMIEGHADSVETDSLGNLIVFKKGMAAPKNKILLSAHMDEVGFILTHIEESGLLRFATVGGIDDRVIIGKAVEVGSRAIPGVIGAKPVHLQEEKERGEPIPPSKLFVDIGADSREEAEAVVSIGERIVFFARFLHMGGNILGRALDDRAGCALLVEMIKAPLPVDCHFAFTVQEETGCTGAITAAYAVDPDISIVVETTTASDIPGVEDGKVVCKLGQGPVVSFMDRGTVYDSGLYAEALKLAAEKGIPCQSKEGVFGGNESRSIQTSRAGARTLAVSLPCRYLHTPSNMLRTSDLEDTLRLLPVLAEAFGRL